MIINRCCGSLSTTFISPARYGGESKHGMTLFDSQSVVAKCPSEKIKRNAV